MRQIYLFLVLFLFTTIIAQAQGTSYERAALIGEWQMDVDEVIASMKPAIKAQYDTIPAVQKSHFRETTASRKFIFSESAFQSTWYAAGKTNSQEGTWELNGAVLKVKFGAQEVLFDILSVEDKKLVLKPQREGRGMTNLLIFKRDDL